MHTMTHLLSTGQAAPLVYTVCAPAFAAAAATAVMARRRQENFLHATGGTTRPLEGIAQSHPEKIERTMTVSSTLLSRNKREQQRRGFFLEAVVCPCSLFFEKVSIPSSNENVV